MVCSKFESWFSKSNQEQLKCVEFHFIAGDIANVLANVVRAPQAYVNLISGALKAVPYTLKSTLGGLTGGLKSKGNLLTKLTGALRGTTTGALNGLQDLYARAIANVLACK